MSVKVYTIFSVDNNDQTSGKKHHLKYNANRTQNIHLCVCSQTNDD